MGALTTTDPDKLWYPVLSTKRKVSKMKWPRPSRTLFFQQVRPNAVFHVTVESFVVMTPRRFGCLINSFNYFFTIFLFFTKRATCMMRCHHRHGLQWDGIECNNRQLRRFERSQVMGRVLRNWKHCHSQHTGKSFGNLWFHPPLTPYNSW